MVIDPKQIFDEAFSATYGGVKKASIQELNTLLEFLPYYRIIQNHSKEWGDGFHGHKPADEHIVKRVIKTIEQGSFWYMNMDFLITAHQLKIIIIENIHEMPEL